jgi:hypothetical protein
MATYPVEFHRRLEQKWESRIEQILTVTGTPPPPRDPTNDDDDEDEDEEDEDQPDQPAVVREPTKTSRFGTRPRLLSSDVAVSRRP